MDRILAASAEIPELENNSIHRLYLIAENHYSKGYNMLMKGSMVESFVLLMRFTKLFELINEHPNRYMRYERYNKIKKNFGNSIGYLEVIKPQLEDKYRRQESKLCLPTAPIGSVFSTENLDEQDKPLEETPESILDEERRKREIDEILLRRWEEFNKPRPKPVPKPVNKTTDDLSDSNKSLSYKDKDGKPLDALAILKMHLENAKS